MTPLQRFLHYVTFDTQSDPSSSSCPSTPGQLLFAQYLAQELTGIGLHDVRLDQYGYLYATLPSNSDDPFPVIGLIAHLDTSPDCPGHDVRPVVDGDLVRTDGSTLLGADDKAGIAAIISAVEYLLLNPQIPHGKVHIAFTPDEEIGRGTEHFDLHHFACDFAYTVDGSSLGSLEYENFNAASASVIFHGINTHPGEAFGVMRNAALLAAQFACRLPLHFRPETTKGREGFFHLTSFQASVSHAELSIILRDFSATGLKTKKGHLIRLANEVNLLHPDACQLSITDQYSNMADILLRNPLPLHLAQRAMQLSGISPRIQPIRGGTDGARLTFLGLPCPNLFTGGAHFHSPQETLSISTFLQAILTLHTLLSLPPSHYPNLPSL